MRIKKYIKNIANILKEWKISVDTLEEKYLREKNDLEKYCDEKRGQWTEAYIEQYKIENSPTEKYRMAYTAAKEPVQKAIERNLSLILNGLDSFFGAPVSQEFANTIMATKLADLQLSNLEFELLKKSVSTYAEARLLNQLALSRTKQTDVVQLKENGEPERVSKETIDPYLHLEIPDMKDTYSKYEKFKDSALRMANSYVGKTGALNFALEHSLPAYICVAMDSFVRNNEDEKFLEIIEKTSSALTYGKGRKVYTENDKKLIDALIDPRYAPSKEKVLSVAAIHEDIEELLRLDPRYAKFFDDEE